MNKISIAVNNIATTINLIEIVWILIDTQTNYWKQTKIIQAMVI